VLRLLLVTNVPLPVLTLHNPGSTTAAVSCSTVLQVAKSGPALTTKLLLTKVTWSTELQPFWTTVHVNTLLPPLRLPTPLVQSVGLDTTGPPLVLHVPTPCVGELADRLPALLQTVWSDPADATTSSLRIRAVLVLLQLPEVTVHTKRLSPIWRLVTEEVALAGDTTVEPPD
jgi:hypothetical protein